MRLPCSLRSALLLTVSFAWVFVSADAAPGDLDVSFHEKGWATFPAGGDGARAMAVQADGRILLTGLAFPPGSLFRLGLWRLHPDGSRDTSFNGTGEVIGEF